MQYDNYELQMPMLSVVVAFRGTEICILDCLQSIFDMDYPKDRLEVVAINDFHNEDLAGQIRTLFPNVKVINNAFPLGCDASKQAGIDAATGDIIAMTDADCTVSPSWARTAVKNIIGGIDIVTGPVRHPKTFLRELIGVSDFQDFQDGMNKNTSNFPGCNFAASRKVFIETRYNTTGALCGGSDRLFSWSLHRKGLRIYYDANMTVFHRPAIDFASLLQRRFTYGKVAVYVRKVDETLPGAIITRLGPLTSLAYVCYKVPKDVVKLFGMTVNQLVNPWHTPVLLACLAMFRLADAIGIAACPICDQKLMILENNTGKK